MQLIHSSGRRRSGYPLLLAVLCTLLPTLAVAAWPYPAPTPQARTPAAPAFPWTAPARPAQPASRAPASPFPWTAPAPARQPVPQARATSPFPWNAPAQPAHRAPAAPAFALPWTGPAQPVRPTPPAGPFGFMAGGSSPYGTPSPGFYGAPGAMPFGGGMGMGGMGGMMSPMMGPMAQGMAGIMAPMMANYAIASMNPTTMNTFMGLMMQNPTGYGGGFPFGGRPQASPFPFGMMGR